MVDKAIVVLGSQVGKDYYSIKKWKSHNVNQLDEDLFQCSRLQLNICKVKCGSKSVMPTSVE